MSIEDIKPDTSLYTDTVDKFRAMIAVLQAKRAGDVVEWKSRSDVGVGWVQAGPTEPYYSNIVLLEWRVAPPKPRTLWVVYSKTGERVMSYADYALANLRAEEIGGTYAKFVEVLP